MIDRTIAGPILSLAGSEMKTVLISGHHFLLK